MKQHVEDLIKDYLGGFGITDAGFVDDGCGSKQLAAIYILLHILSLQDIDKNDVYRVSIWAREQLAAWHYDDWHMQLVDAEIGEMLGGIGDE